MNKTFFEEAVRPVDRLSLRCLEQEFAFTIP